MTGKKTMGSSSAGTAAKKPRTTTRKATKAKDVPVVVLEEDEEEAALTLSVEEKDTLECDFCCLPFEWYTEKLGHEETCPRAPYDCPNGGEGGFAAIGGGIRGTEVTVRRDAPFRVLLQRDRDRVFLLLNGRDLLQGRSLSLLCLGPRPEGGVELEYDMEVGGGGALSLSASGTVPFARRLEAGFLAKAFLFVPDSYWGSSGTVSVRVRV